MQKFGLTALPPTRSSAFPLEKWPGFHRSRRRKKDRNKRGPIFLRWKWLRRNLREAYWVINKCLKNKCLCPCFRLDQWLKLAKREKWSSWPWKCQVSLLALWHTLNECCILVAAFSNICSVEYVMCAKMLKCEPGLTEADWYKFIKHIFEKVFLRAGIRGGSRGPGYWGAEIR